VPSTTGRSTPELEPRDTGGEAAEDVASGRDPSAEASPTVEWLVHPDARRIRATPITVDLLLLSKVVAMRPSLSMTVSTTTVGAPPFREPSARFLRTVLRLGRRSTGP
jgi:hypothetical protein